MVKIVSPWLTLVASFLETPHIYVHGLYDQTMGLLRASNLHFTVSARAETIH